MLPLDDGPQGQKGRTAMTAEQILVSQLEADLALAKVVTQRAYSVPGFIKEGHPAFAAGREYHRIADTLLSLTGKEYRPAA